MRLGRNVVASDINPLATFVTRAKTSRLDDESILATEDWLRELPDSLNLRNAEPDLSPWTQTGHMRHLDTQLTWRKRKLIALSLASLEELPLSAKRLCRCVLLRTAQWALDMRPELPTATVFRSVLEGTGRAMLEVASQELASYRDRNTHVAVIDVGLPGLSKKMNAVCTIHPRLIITSPPYPGVYVNYHRWKLLGRKEIRTPYWIAGTPDGHGMAYYTMRARSQSSLDGYFESVRLAFEDIDKLLRQDTLVVQLVGFNNPDSQFRRYLSTMRDCGLEEIKFPSLSTADDGRLWRRVRGRRWWSEVHSRRGVTRNTAHEVVLIHRRARTS